jgi:3-dehydroquinate dehydratase-2
VESLVIEVHITNISAREDFRQVSLIARACAGSISGFGLDGYRLAVEALIALQDNKGK